MPRLPTLTPAPAVLSYTKAAAYLGLPSAAALRTMHHRGNAPPSFKYGKRSRFFLVSRLDEWLANRERAGRAEDAAPVPAALPAPPRRAGRPTKMEAIERRSGKPG